MSFYLFHLHPGCPQRIKVYNAGLMWNIDKISHFYWHLHGLLQERHNSTANALELRLSCTNPLIYNWQCHQYNDTNTHHSKIITVKRHDISPLMVEYAVLKGTLTKLCRYLTVLIKIDSVWVGCAWSNMGYILEINLNPKFQEILFSDIKHQSVVQPLLLEWLQGLWMCHNIIQSALVLPRVHFVYAPRQWETLHCNVVSHWLGAYTKWSLLPCLLHHHEYHFIAYMAAPAEVRH